MSYTYPEALTALESVANDFIKVLRPREIARVLLVCDSAAQTASVTWDAYNIKVNMPVRPAASRMTQAEFENWVSYLLHELGHPAHTDMVAWQAACRDGVARMVNALEDVRMEKALIVSGIVPNAKSVLSRLLSRKIVEARSNGWKPNARREFGWTICVLGRAANGYAFDGVGLDRRANQSRRDGSRRFGLGLAGFGRVQIDGRLYSPCKAYHGSPCGPSG